MNFQIETWSKELENKIVSDKDKVLFNEAIRCLENKTYRAGYILAWLSIVESLRNKIQELAATGNVQADNCLKSIETKEKSLQSNDNTIINEAEKCGFINSTEKNQLEFLYRERCKFAHPYFQQPTSTELIHIIERSVYLALSKEILFKKDYIEELVTNILEKPHYLPNNNEYITSFALEKINRIDQSLYPFLFKTLYYKLSMAYEKDVSETIVNKLLSFIRVLLYMNGDDIQKVDWALERNATDYPNIFCQLINEDVWQHFSQRVKIICLEYVKSSNDENSFKRQARIRIKQLIEKNILERDFIDEFNAFLSNTPLSISGELYKLPCNELFERIIECAQSFIYSDNTSAISFLYTDDGQNFLHSLSNEQKVELGVALAISAENNSYSSRNYLRSIHDTKSKIFEGIIYGCFYFDKNQFLFRKRVFEIAIFRINECEDDENLQRIFQDILNKYKALAFDGSTYLNNLHYSKNDIDKVLESKKNKEYVVSTLNYISSNLESIQLDDFKGS